MAVFDRRELLTAAGVFGALAVSAAPARASDHASSDDALLPPDPVSQLAKHIGERTAERYLQSRRDPALAAELQCLAIEHRQYSTHTVLVGLELTALLDRLQETLPLFDFERFDIWNIVKAHAAKQQQRLDDLHMSQTSSFYPRRPFEA